MARRRRGSSVTDELQRIMEMSQPTIIMLPLEDIAPYEMNPRDNVEAVPAVEKSIREFGFKVPVVVDDGNILVAGHTRCAAAERIGMPSVPAIRASDLTPSQVQAFRVIDNKVAELANWDFDMLASEVSALREEGVDLTEFGWKQEEIDCLSDVVADDCLSGESIEDMQQGQQRSTVDKRAPERSRFVCGELVFFIPAGVYREWVNDIRSTFDFDEADIEAELKRRLGITQFED